MRHLPWGTEAAEPLTPLTPLMAQTKAGHVPTWTPHPPTPAFINWSKTSMT